jgi:acetoacetyl-CoA synthetase
MDQALWSPSQERINNTEMFKFIKHMQEKFGLPDDSYQTLHKFSVNRSGVFWSEIMDYFGVQYTGELEPACTDHGFSEYGWFPNVRLNFAQNLLAKGKSEKTAIVSLLENGTRREISFGDLRSQVSGLAQSLKSYINEGDVLACYMPNISETITSMLATTSLGGVFTSTSCDFGIEGVVDRFGQSKPKVLVTCAGYEYNGKYFDLTDKLIQIVSQIDSIEKVIVVDFVGKGFDTSKVANSVLWTDFSQPSDNEIEFVQRKFSDPLYIMYSSGTTGKPKCIVHSTGGTLLQHVKELGLHTDLNENKNIFYFTTCGWMMWNWLVSSLYFGGVTTLYEGSPAYPSFNEFVKIIEREKLSIFGTSPKFLRALEDSSTDLSSVDMSSLETILSTGAPLLPDQFEYVYKSFKSDLLLASISGGTDIIGCFFLGNPILPVVAGELQCIGLGMDGACFDDSGKEVIGQEGELVCKRSFPSRPIYFLSDENNERINDAYFNKYENIWHHGDFISISESGAVKVLGRSDATLNPGGVRIGTAEIYRQTETLSYLTDSICVGKQIDGDVEVQLFVKMNEGIDLTTEMIKEIKKLIKDNTTPRHVPRRVIAITDIPYTRSGKKMEMAVAKLINGRALNNIEAVANPACLEEYKQYV